MDYHTLFVVVITILGALLPPTTQGFLFNRPNYPSRPFGGIGMPFRHRDVHSPQMPSRQYRHPMDSRYRQPMDNRYRHQMDNRYRQPMDQHYRHQMDNRYRHPVQQSGPVHRQPRELPPRRFQILDQGSFFEIQIESQEVRKNDEFNVQVDDTRGELHVRDRSRNFDKTWQLPSGVTKYDVKLDTTENMLQIFVPKVGHHSESGAPPRIQDASPEMPSAPKTQPPAMTMEPCVVDDGLFVEEASGDLPWFGDQDFKDPGAMSGYMDLRGNFVEY